MPGKCLFNEEWLSRYKEWLKPCEKNNRKGWCSWCKKEIDVASMGESALKKHMTRKYFLLFILSDWVFSNLNKQ